MKSFKATAWLALATGGVVAVSMAPRSAAGPGDPPTEGEPWHKYSPTDKSSYLTIWNSIYPDSTIPDRMSAAAGQTCYLCHETAGRSAQGNCYKEDMLVKLNMGLSVADAINAIDGDDSDGDGTPNGVEILMPRLDMPGEVGYNPGLIGPTGADPCSQVPGNVVSNQPETPPAACYPDCDTSTGAGVLDIFDFLCFQSSFVAAEPYACDCDMSTGPGVCDIFDFLCFQSAFVGGCP